MIQICDFGPRDKQELRDLMDVAEKRSEDPNCCMCAEFQELQGDAPEFLQGRVNSFAEIVEMSTDAEWDLPILDRKRVKSAGKYLHELRTGSLSSVESAILGSLGLDLVANDLTSELELYREFCEFRTTAEEPVGRMDFLRHKRASNQANEKTFFGMRRSNIRRAWLTS